MESMSNRLIWRLTCSIAILYLDKLRLKALDYYNHKRIHGKLKGLSPVLYRSHVLLSA